ncbi:uncharacterized protein [Triticum aestivum]|uniref:uncharacterized protein n=1 Tax=Triticum aestivum TaxID=4565 RepID=UPI001D01A8E9|nr:uncharacterized protein LOC123161620 [Triticum aestivum]
MRRGADPSTTSPPRRRGRAVLPDGGPACVPSILPVKTLNVQAFITEYAQLQKLPTRPQGMFMHLRHMTCQLTLYSSDRNADNGVLQLAHCLDAAPGLETLHLHMCYHNLNGYCSSEVVSMRPHGNLKMVFMSGFHCYKTQIELACCILGNACVLEQLTIEPRVILGNARVLKQLTIEPRVTDSVHLIDCPESRLEYWPQKNFTEGL